MKIEDFKYREDRDRRFDKLESKGVKVEAWRVKNVDFEYNECRSGRYLVTKDIFRLKIYEKGEEYDEPI